MRQLFWLLALAACSPYDPDFGATPFLCGQNEPRCPEGYFCIQEADTGRQICSDTAPDDFDCVADPNEPNQNTAAPTTTAIDTQSTVTLDGLAVCPDDDVDVYQLTVSAIENIELLVTYEGDGAPLEGHILNTGGVPIANAALLEGTTIRALASDLDPGTYFVQIKGPDAGAVTVNNYSLTINVQ
jgi:hypothetical protein